MMPRRFRICHGLLLTIAVSGLGATTASAQQTHSGHGRHYVYDQFVPPGVAGQMQAIAGTIRPTVPQQVKLVLPGDGAVTVYDGALNRPVSTAAPAQFAMLVGHMYRFEVSGLADYPHTTFYPSVELVGELHPPPGQAERFPIEIELLDEEFRWVMRGQMVTKVVYLEQADRVPLQNLSGAPRVIDVERGRNAVAEADALGRPIAIVRLGGRTPDPNQFDPQFWGPLPPVRLVTPPEPTLSQQSSVVPVIDAPPLAVGRSSTKVFPAAATTPQAR